MEQNTKRRAFVILIARSGASIPFKPILADIAPLSLVQIKKSISGISNQDAIRILSLTDGLAGLVALYDSDKSFEENVRDFMRIGSPYYNLAVTWLNEAFRSPESYNALLYAMATGHNRISELSSITGYPNNKCDKYLKALDAAGFIKQSKRPDETGRQRTNYTLRSGYLKLWYTTFYPDYLRYLKLLSDEELRLFILEIEKKKAAEVFRKSCFRWLHANGGKINCQSLIHLENRSQYDVSINGCHFDFVQQNGDRMLFVKIWDNPANPPTGEEWSAIDSASSKTNPFYNNEYVLFAVENFPYAYRKASAQYENVHLVTTDHLRISAKIDEDI